MNMLRKMRNHIERFVGTPREELGRLGRVIRFQAELWRFCARRLRDNNVMAMSAALSFRTIFAMIPIIVLIFLAAKSLGVIEDSKRSLRRVLDSSGFSQIASVEQEWAPTDAGATIATRPGRVLNVADEIETLVARVDSKLTFERLGPIGSALFIWTALTLLSTVERSLNRVFGASSRRALARRLLLYWSATTLGPVALALASYLGKLIIETFAGAPGVSWLMIGVGKVGPVIVGILVLAAMYTWIPNVVVRFRATLGGAAVAVALWLLAKWGFSQYVQGLVVKGNLYGVLGVIPLFMLWLNFSWLIFLFGAELAHTGANLATMQLAERAQKTVLGPSDLLAAAVAIAQPYAACRGFASFDDLANKLNLPTESVRWLLDRLRNAGLINPVDTDAQTCYVLTRPAERLLVTEILDLGDPRDNFSRSGTSDPEVAAAVGSVHRRTRNSLGRMTLSDLLTHTSAATDDKPVAAPAPETVGSDAQAV